MTCGSRRASAWAYHSQSTAPCLSTISESVKVRRTTSSSGMVRPSGAATARLNRSAGGGGGGGGRQARRNPGTAHTGGGDELANMVEGPAVVGRLPPVAKVRIGSIHR